MLQSPVLEDTGQFRASPGTPFQDSRRPLGRHAAVSQDLSHPACSLVNGLNKSLSRGDHTFVRTTLFTFRKLVLDKILASNPSQWAGTPPAGRVMLSTTQHEHEVSETHEDIQTLNKQFRASKM